MSKSVKRFVGKQLVAEYTELGGLLEHCSDVLETSDKQFCVLNVGV